MNDETPRANQTDKASSQANARLQESEQKYRLLFENMTTGFAVFEMLYDQHGTPVDFLFLDVNPAFERLTGLPNRVLLIDRFNIAAALAHRNKAKLAIMSLDLDKFKSINDTFGHDVGDQVLKIIGRRLTRIMRASDTFARVGGDEFISVMMETSHMEDATAVAQKILDSFAEPLSVGGHQLFLSTSIGIAVYPDDGKDLETLTKKSDAAMYHSKNNGRNRFTFYKDTPVD